MTPQAPSVGEMVAIMRRRPASEVLLEMETGDLLALAKSEVDNETRMLAEVLAVMTPGQRKLLAWKARRPERAYRCASAAAVVALTP